MNQKPLILAIGLLAGAAAVYFIPKALKGPGESNSNTTTADTVVAEVAPEVAPVTAAPVQQVFAPVKQSWKAAPPVVSAWSKLAEKYGAEKTALSHKITSNLTSVITQGIELANTAARNSGSGSIAEAASKAALRNASGKLALTEDQEKQAAAIIQSAVEKRMSAVTDLTSAMSSEPEQIMAMMLAGDALARKEITQAEYDQLTGPTRTMLKNVGGFVGGRGGNGAQILGDPETTAQLNAILTPEQQTKFAEMTAKWQADMQARAEAQNNSGNPFQPGEIPIMELDKLDQSIASVRQMTDAAKLMMEAMKGLKDASSTNR
jgi:hypothetical protein